MTSLSLLRRALLNRLYFSPLRCMPGHRAFLLTGAVLALGVLATRGSASVKWNGIAAAMQCTGVAAYTVLALLRYALSYPGTNVIAHGNGRNRWTIHMGPAVSLLPWYYARQHSAFIRQDVYKMLHQIDRNAMTATVRLESPLLADAALRRLAAARLRQMFPHWQVREQVRPTPLAPLTAWQLTRLRQALRRRKGSRPFAPFRAGAPVGLIVLTVVPRRPPCMAAMSHRSFS